VIPIEKQVPFESRAARTWLASQLGALPGFCGRIYGPNVNLENRNYNFIEKTQGSRGNSVNLVIRLQVG
jgi:hypothetical protein